MARSRPRGRAGPVAEAAAGIRSPAQPTEGQSTFSRAEQPRRGTPVPSSSARLDGEGHYPGGDGGVEAVGAARHRDFHQQITLGLIFSRQTLLLIADQQEAGPV